MIHITAQQELTPLSSAARDQGSGLSSSSSYFLLRIPYSVTGNWGINLMVFHLYTVECPIICNFFMLCVVLESFCRTSQVHRPHSYHSISAEHNFTNCSPIFPIVFESEAAVTIAPATLPLTFEFLKRFR